MRLRRTAQAVPMRMTHGELMRIARKRLKQTLEFENWRLAPDTSGSAEMAD